MGRTVVTTPGALDGMRVADFSRILAGPLCTMILGDLGADVIKVEHPLGGDDTRGWGPPFVGEDAAYFLSVNRNKRSVALDLAEPRDREVAQRLALSADVLVENLRPGGMARFGLGYEDLSDDNPGLVYCSITAFPAGDGEDRPGYDLLIQAMSGLMSLTGPEGGEPTKVGVALVDVITGLQAAIGVLAALQAREAEGRGQRVEVTLFGSSVAALVNQAANHLIAGMIPRPMGNAHPSIVPYQVFHASDRTFVLAVGNDRQFAKACEAIGRQDLAADERFVTNAGRVAERAELIGALESHFRLRTAAHWLERLDAAGVPAGPVRDLGDVFASPEGRAMVVSLADPARGDIPTVGSPLGLLGTPPSYRLPPPRLGEHTDAVLRELGLA